MYIRGTTYNLTGVITSLIANKGVITSACTLSPSTGYLYYNGSSYLWQAGTGYTSYQTAYGLNDSTYLNTNSSSAVISIDFGAQTYTTDTFLTSAYLSQSITSFVTSLS